MRKYNLAIDLTKSAPPLHNMASHLPNTVPQKHYLEGAVCCSTPGLNRNHCDVIISLFMFKYV